jgi:hypothetical protein
VRDVVLLLVVGVPCCPPELLLVAMSRTPLSRVANDITSKSSETDI